MRIERKYCDVCNSEEKVFKDKLQVIFTTDPTEGRACSNFLCLQDIDLCKKCKDKVLEGNYIMAAGAMGHYKYLFKEAT